MQEWQKITQNCRAIIKKPKIFSIKCAKTLKVYGDISGNTPSPLP